MIAFVIFSTGKPWDNFYTQVSELYKANMVEGKTVAAETGVFFLPLKQDHLVLMLKSCTPFSRILNVLYIEK